MRTFAVAAVALLASASSALAAPAAVSVTLAPKFAEKARESLGLKEVNGLADELRRTIEHRLADSPAFDGARLELVIEDAKPNRPTYKQLTDTPGLSLDSIGIGGIRIAGRAVARDGKTSPVAFSWYETDIQNVRGYATWTDAERGVSLFADRLAHGDALAAR